MQRRGRLRKTPPCAARARNGRSKGVLPQSARLIFLSSAWLRCCRTILSLWRRRGRDREGTVQETLAMIKSPCRPVSDDINGLLRRPRISLFDQSMVGREFGRALLCFQAASPFCRLALTPRPFVEVEPRSACECRRVIWSILVLVARTRTPPLRRSTSRD